MRFIQIYNFYTSNNKPSTGVDLVVNLEKDRSEIGYMKEFVAPSRSNNTFRLFGLDQEFLSYAVFQLHTFYFNVTLATRITDTSSSRQTGSNLGFVIKPGRDQNVVHMFNDNYEEVQCLVAVIVYNKSVPLIGGCNLDNSILENPRIILEESESFTIVKTCLAKPSNESSCLSDTYMKHSTYFIYLEQMDFDYRHYFDGIKSVMSTDMFNKGIKAKEVYSPLKQYFEKVPGTGIIINSVAVGSDGLAAFYIPAVTYSCPPNTWNTHCSDVDMLKRALSVLLVLHAVVMIFNLVMPELIESALNGMLIGSFLTLAFTSRQHLLMTNVEIFMTTVIGGLFISAVCGTISLFFKIGRYFTKLTFSSLAMVIVMEVFSDTTTSPYLQFGGAFILSILLQSIRISCSVFLGGLLLMIGLSNLVKVGNIHRIFVNNYRSLSTVYSSLLWKEESVWQFSRKNFINYKISLNSVDLAMIIFYVLGAILLTIRKENYFSNNPNPIDGDHLFSESEDILENQRIARNYRDKCIIGIQRSRGQLRIISRCRRHHYRSNVINERSPLITHWLASDESEDDVFESPNSNSRFMRSLSSESKERINAIQNFLE